MKKNHKRISAAVLSLALGFTIAGAPMLAPVASAQLSITAGQASTVDTRAEVSLNIKKYLGEVGDTTNTLEGITFNVQRIDLGDLNLDTLAGWNAVVAAQSALQDGNLPQLTGAEYALTTDDVGEASIATATTPEFTVGAYLVTEVNSGEYTVAPPFIVTLPHTHDEDGVWDYNLTVSPKNQAVSVNKDVEDAGIVLGQNVKYTITASLPGENLTSLEIEDPLPAELGAATNVVVGTIGATDPDDNIELNLGADYSLVTTGGDGNDLLVTLTEVGLGKLSALRATNPGLALTVVFNSQVVALPNSGTFTNDVIVRYPNSTVDTSTTPDPEDGAETRLGQLTVNKTDSENNPLTGDAIFELWRCSLNDDGAWVVEGEEGALPIITDPNVDTADELAAYTAGSPDGVMPTSFTTAPTGSATIYGVQAFNFENGADTDDPNICLVETQAPAGYNLNPQPVPVDTYANANDPASAQYAMVSNFQNLKNDDIVNLPETGGKGTMALIGAGVLVAAVGGAAAVRGNRARNN